MRDGFTVRIEDENCTCSILQITGDQASVPFLPSCVPQLNTTPNILVRDIFPDEIDPNGWLTIFYIRYLIARLKLIIYETIDDGGFARGAVTQ